ncbi:unnamed protein product, partial [Pylaiella littoralis]
QALAASQEDRQEGKSEGITAARGLQAYWSCQLGEPALDIFVAKFSRALGPGCVDIVVLGERTLFTLREQGTIRLQKVLGYQPACACKFVVVAAPGEEGARLTGTTVRENDEGFAAVVEEENLIVAAETDQLMVYKDLQLVWQAMVSRTPVALTVAKFGAMPGIVCTLDDEGVLTACYQGTDPPTSSVVAAETKEVDYDQINQEHRKLLQVIRRSQTDPARPPAGKLTLQVQVPRFLDDRRAHQQRQQIRQHGDGRTGGFYDEDAPRGSSEGQQADAASVTARFVITYSGPGELRNATLNISPPPGFSAEPSSALLPSIRGTENGGKAERGGGNEPLVIEIVLRAGRATERLPATLVGQASVVYTRPGTGGDEQSEPMSARCDLRVPLPMAGRVVEPSTRKGGNTLKFTFTTSRPAVMLRVLFEDMAMSTHRADDGGDSTSSMARGSQDVTVAVSKNSGRYRVQSESLSALCVVASEVVRRLREYFGVSGAERNRASQDCVTVDEETEIPRDGSSHLRIEYTEALPLQEFYGIIDEHFERRRDLHNASESLNRAAHQFRVVEKRVLSRFKDRNPSPLDSLDVVLEDTFQRLVELCEGVERAQGRLAVSAASLRCAVRFVAMLAQHRFQLPCKDHALLLAHLFPDVTDTQDQGWEECVDAAMTHLLRTSLAKVAKESASPSAGQTPPLSMPPDTVKLKKHISIVCDRLNKGARLTL